MDGYIVIGIGRFGRSVARTLYENNKTVLAIDMNEEIIQKIIDEEIVAEAIVMDTTDENALKKVADCNDFGTAFVCMGTDIQSSILTTMSLKELGIRRVICKARTDRQGEILKRIGADLVVYPEREMGESLAKKIINPYITEHFRFSEKFSIFEFEAPKKFVGKNLKELDLRNRYEMNIISIRKENEKLEINPKADTVIEEKSILLVMADSKKSKELWK